MKKIFILWTLLFSACTPTSPLTTTRWSGQGPQPSFNLDKTALKKEATQSSVNEEVEISQQTVDKFLIEGSFVKTISKKNNVVFQSSALAKNISNSLISLAKKMDKNKESAWQIFIQKNSNFKDKKILEPVQVIFITSPKLEPVYQSIIESSRGEIQAIHFFEDGKLISNTRVGSNLTETIDSLSIVFPKGPKKSELTSVLLNRKVQPEGLANTLVEVTSLSPNKILASSNLEYQTSDDRFDQVQAFYYSELILKWFNQKLSLRGPLKLNITTHLGFPEKTNAAFYFQNQIRLGAGDDITFSNISWDPSIVMHETSHSVIDLLSRLPFQGEGGSLNEGFADFFTTFYLDSPLLGENSYRPAPFKRTVEQTLKLSEKNGGLYHDSAIVSGFFWSLKKIIGPDKTLAYGVHVLNRLGPNSTFSDFKLSLKEQSLELFTGDELKKVNSLLTERELQ